MKQNKIKLYAKALSEIIFADEKTRGRRASTDSVVVNFVKLLVKDGQEKKAKEILNLAEDLLLAKQGKRKITFEIARRLSAGHRAMLKEFVKEGDKVHEKVNHELIAGIKIIINDSRQFDASMQSKLQKIL